MLRQGHLVMSDMILQTYEHLMQILEIFYMYYVALKVLILCRDVLQCTFRKKYLCSITVFKKWFSQIF